MTRIEKLSPFRAKTVIKNVDFTSIEERTMDYFLMMSTFMWAGYVDNEIACVWGVVPPSLMSNRAYLWLFTTDVIKEHQFLLVRHSQVVIKEILKEYPVIVGHVLLGASKSMRWLKWLGAEFGYPQGNLIPFRISNQG
jgi:hypothetical protein